MTLLEHIQRAAHAEAASPALSVFLYGRDKAAVAARRVSGATKALVASLDLGGDDFAPLEPGQHQGVYANRDTVFKVALSSTSFIDDGRSIPLNEIPKGLASKIIAHGMHHGIAYLVGERIAVKRHVPLEDILAYLFKARDAGIVYWDPRPSNFGYDKAGDPLPLDHEHFQRNNEPRGNFEWALQRAVVDHRVYYNTAYPLAVSDKTHTYIVLGGNNDIDADFSERHRRAMDILAALGLQHDVEHYPEAHIIRIPRTQVTYGTPPHSEPLAEYIQHGLNAKAVETSREAPLTARGI